MPDQMMLQVHESIGHPLELDRILGDERNYAGTSFVTLDMLGRYALRLAAAQRHLRPVDSGGARELRLRRRGHARREGLADPQRHPGAAARRRTSRSCARACPGRRTRGRRAGTARRSIAWRTSTSSPATSRLADMIAFDRARRADAHQRLLVDRRLAQQVPVRLRVGRADRERADHRRGEESELPRDLRDLLAQPEGGRRPRPRSRSTARSTAARASPTRRSTSATRRPRACSRASTCSAARAREGPRSSVLPTGSTGSSARARRCSARSTRSVRISCASTAAQVRQAGSVQQRFLSVRLVRERRQAAATLAIAGDGEDLALARGGAGPAARRARAASRGSVAAHRRRSRLDRNGSPRPPRGAGGARATGRRRG